ncbi:hypothetical protein DSO57_1006870 [Entomophthora muscae]|uniref:Uncharacterized protein n=1 Tax=Entomophthora muscae TaxID=34485 RepID=A0ACC2SKJ3_9FUNG|nr:hypothetical protein DSO57_1006870 [Entomophthora muscae]
MLHNRIEGLSGAAFCDKEGVVIIKVVDGEDTDKILESSTLSSVFLLASDQVSRMGLKRNNSIVGIYDNHQIIQFNISSFIVTFVADSACNTGVLMDLQSELTELILPLSSILGN